MKNIKKYKYKWKEVKGKPESFKVEVKLEQLYCYSHHDYLPIKRFPNESGYGTRNRTICDSCLQRKEAKRRRTGTGLTPKDRVYRHYGGYKCVDGGEEKEEILTLHHVHFNGKECRLEACGSKYQYHSTVYHYWLIRNNYPPKHEQVVLCQNCHTLRHIEEKKKKKRKHTIVKKTIAKGRELTDEEKLKEMFGIPKEEKLV